MVNLLQGKYAVGPIIVVQCSCDVGQSLLLYKSQRSESSYILYKCIGDHTRAAARRSPNCIRKKTFYGTPVFIPLPKFCEKELLPASSHKISLKSVNQLLNHGQKRFLKRPHSGILKMFIKIWSSRCLSSSSRCAVVYPIGWFFRLNMAIALAVVVPTVVWLAVAQYYFRFRIWWRHSHPNVKIYMQTKFRWCILIHGCDITTSGFEK